MNERTARNALVARESHGHRSLVFDHLDLRCKRYILPTAHCNKLCARRRLHDAPHPLAPRPPHKFELALEDKPNILACTGLGFRPMSEVHRTLTEGRLLPFAIGVSAGFDEDDR